MTTDQWMLPPCTKNVWDDAKTTQAFALLFWHATFWKWKLRQSKTIYIKKMVQYDPHLPHFPNQMKKPSHTHNLHNEETLEAEDLEIHQALLERYCVNPRD